MNKLIDSCKTWGFLIKLIDETRDVFSVKKPEDTYKFVLIRIYKFLKKDFEINSKTNIKAFDLKQNFYNTYF